MNTTVFPGNKLRKLKLCPGGAYDLARTQTGDGHDDDVCLKRSKLNDMILAAGLLMIQCAKSINDFGVQCAKSMTWGMFIYRYLETSCGGV